MKLFEVRNLRVRFDTPRGAVQAVEEFSLELEPGETVALVGESGSGKSVTGLALLGLLTTPPAVIETGEVLFAGRNLLALEERELAKLRGREIAMVFQDPKSALHPLLTIGRQLSEVLEVHEGLSRRDARVRCVEALAEVGLAEPESVFDSLPHELSGGMRQRAMIAMALLCRPKVLIADEPTTALDATVQVEILELLAGLQKKHGIAIVFVSHDLGLVARLAHRVQVMYAGRVIETASTTELFREPQHPYTRGLLAGVPRLDRGPGGLVPIPGSPPDPLVPAPGCAFAPRCAFVVERCRKERPGLIGSARAVADVLRVGGRRVACFERERVAALAASEGGGIPGRGELGRSELGRGETPGHGESSGGAQ